MAATTSEPKCRTLQDVRQMFCYQIARRTAAKRKLGATDRQHVRLAAQVSVLRMMLRAIARTP